MAGLGSREKRLVARTNRAEEKKVLSSGRSGPNKFETTPRLTNLRLRRSTLENGHRKREEHLTKGGREQPFFGIGGPRGGSFTAPHQAEKPLT